MNLKNFKITNKGLYWGLIFTFALLYICVGFVSTLHSITFFNLANNVGLAILLGITYEIGQASVLFSILMTKNKEKFLPWALMFLLTALQVTANVYASFKFMANSGNNDWQYWQKSILIGVQAQNTEMYQVIISWIAGALLPIVALGMTALVAQNIKLITEEKENLQPELPEDLKEPTLEKQEKITDFIEKEERIITNLQEQSDLKQFENHIIYNENEKSIGIEGISNHGDPPGIEETNINELIGPPKKKAGRPPKSKESVAEPKKEKELLPSEDVRVPEKRKRIVNPLRQKKKKIKPIKDLKELFPPSKGDEAIELIENMQKDQAKESINSLPKDEEISQESILVPPQILNPYLQGGVEVIDAKAIPVKDGEKKTEVRQIWHPY